MIQPKLWAQLGNQCFMISAAIAHALKMNTTYSIPKKTISPGLWRTYFSHLPETKSATLHYYKEKRHCYDPLPEVDSLTIEGYFQSEKYWHGYKEKIAEALGFVFIPREYVSIHLRRGDYLRYPDQFPVMPMEYYYAAIEYFRSKGFIKFKVHSDDIPFCKTQINSVYIKGIEVEYSNICDPLADMQCMYNAAGFIIANSSFSLFPALLRPDNPMVIAPAENRWYGPKASHLETEDLMPERFIKM
jgi:hypothetical protein